MNNSNTSGCSCSGGCCPQPEKRLVKIEFLYLDLSVCERCQGAESNLDAALREVASVLGAAGYAVQVDKINVTTPELAIRHEFESSPTIRVNGKDIALEVHETLCQECGDLCGTETQCRSWVYEGEEYAEPPKAMIISAILKEVFGGGQPTATEKKPYVLPENLAAFFAGLQSRQEQ